MSIQLSAGARAAADVASLLRARNTLLWIVSREEARGGVDLAPVESVPSPVYASALLGQPRLEF